MGYHDCQVGLGWDVWEWVDVGWMEGLKVGLSVGRG